MVKNRKMASFIMALVITLTVALGEGGPNVSAAGDDDKIVVVSLGDSYSSGEGIGAGTDVKNSEDDGKGLFYGYTGNVKTDMNNVDWLAHRSKYSWPSRLEIPGIPGILRDYHVQLNENQKPEGGEDKANFKWYFVASSGATTYDVMKLKVKGKLFASSGQKKKIRKVEYIGNKKLPFQIEIFDEILPEKADYVTLTIGGNDVDFAGIITDAMLSGKYFRPKKLQKKLDKLWDEIDEYRSRIKTTYQTIAEKAGSQATIIVAGYPELLYVGGNGKAIGFSADQSKLINENVIKFNRDVLAELVEQCRGEGIDIWFADVAAKFNGHQAYSQDPYINPVILKPNPDDISNIPPSAYSIHPNDEGARVYAECVNEKIKQCSRDYQIVLSWGKDPSDLDAHLEGTLSDGSAFHLYYKDLSVKDGGVEICDLDKDYMMYYGPETVSLNVTSDKPYYYYVERLRGAGKIQTSGAKVDVYRGGELVETFEVPTGEAKGEYWNVFAIVDGKIVSQNTISTKADVSYAE